MHLSSERLATIKRRRLVTQLNYVLYLLHKQFVMQTLTELSLWGDKLGDEGTHLISGVLKTNTVGTIHFPFLVDIRSYTDNRLS